MLIPFLSVAKKAEACANDFCDGSAWYKVAASMGREPAEQIVILIVQ